MLLVYLNFVALLESNPDDFMVRFSQRKQIMVTKLTLQSVVPQTRLKIINHFCHKDNPVKTSQAKQ